jgi:glycosyltransferase involved in cell wall biosynthesis
MNNKLPRVSIITPSLNQGCFIEETINSVLSQGYPNLEYIVMDGESKDNTLDILRKFSDKIKWTSTKDNGQAHAINKGIKMATGDIISFLNADDLLENLSLFKVSNAFIQNPELLWLTGRCKIIDDNTREIRKVVTWYKNILLKIKSENILYVINYISQPSTFWKREVMDQIGKFNEKYNFVMDYDYFIRLWQVKKPLVLDEDLSCFRIHQKSKTVNSSISNQWLKEEKAMIRSHINSGFYLFLHDLHRKLISSVYSKINQ